MAFNTYKTYLMSGTKGASALTKLIDIKSFPDMGKAPDLLETTTLSDPQHTYIFGLEGVTDALEFTCNYTSDDYDTIAALKDTEQSFGLYLGDETGSEGKFTFDGYIAVVMNGKNVNEVREMTLYIAPTSKVTKA